MLRMERDPTAVDRRLILVIAFLAPLIGLGAVTRADEPIQQWRTPGGGLYFGDRPPPGSSLVGTTASMGTIGGGPVGTIDAPERTALPRGAQLPLANPSDAPVATGVSLAKRTRLYFDTWSQRGLSASELEIVEQNLNAVRNDVGRALEVDPDARFDVILTEPEVFHRYSGTRSHIAGLFDGKIHIPIPTKVNERELQGTLWHEYTHAVISVKTRGRCPVWLNEGLATYQQAKVDPQIRENLPALLTSQGKLPYDWADLDTTLHSAAASPRAQLLAYVQAYAIVDYLYTRYRAQRVNRLLDELRASGDIVAALRETLQTTLERLDQQVVEHVRGG